MNTLLYFGCIRDAGHFLWLNESRHLWAAKDILKHTGITVGDKFTYQIDGKFTPKSIQTQGAGKEGELGPFKVFSWHDYTVDGRPGSNSTLLGIGYKSVQEMLDAAVTEFPSVMKRQPKPVSTVEGKQQIDKIEEDLGP